jgi:hypothetical protein
VNTVFRSCRPVAISTRAASSTVTCRKLSARNAATTIRFACADFVAARRNADPAMVADALNRP